MDLFFDNNLQQVVGYRAPVKAADVDINDLEEIYTFDYFLRMLADKPEKYTAGTGEQSLVDEDYRRAVGQSLTTWYEQSKISPHEVFLLVDEKGDYHHYRRIIKREVETYQLLVPDGPKGGRS